jgi:hypothetical protein
MVAGEQREEQEGARNKTPFKSTFPVTYLFQLGPISYLFPIMTLNCEPIND